MSKMISELYSHDEMIYRLPQINDYDLLKEYVIEHFSNREKTISASVGMTSMDFNDWISKLYRNDFEVISLSDKWQIKRNYNKIEL